MSNTISAPVSDRCLFLNCGLPRSEHPEGKSGHRFVGPGQLRLREPVDPFRNIRQMTEEEKARSAERSVTLVPTAASPSKVTTKPAAKLTPDERRVIAKKAADKRWGNEPTTSVSCISSDPRKCDQCGKERTRHRGNIGHRFTKFDAGPPKAVAEKPPCVTCGKQPGAHRGRHAAKLGHLYRWKEPGAAIPIPDVMKILQAEVESDFPSLRRPSPPPVLTTRAMIVESIERAIATIDVARNPIVRELRLKVEVNLEREILTAEAMVCLTMTFERETGT